MHFLLEEKQSGVTFTQSLCTQREQLLLEQERLKNRIENIDRTLNLIATGDQLLHQDIRLMNDIEQGERFSIVDQIDILYVRASHGRDFSISTRNAQALNEFVHLLPKARYLRIIRQACFNDDSPVVDPDYIVGIHVTDRSLLQSSPMNQLELLRLGRCLCYIRRESRETSVLKETFDPVFTYLHEHGYRLRGDMLIVPTFLNLDGQGQDIELVYAPIL